MTEQAPALKIIFQKIEKKLLKKILSIEGKPLELDWALPSPDFEEALFDALRNLRVTNEVMFSEFCADSLNFFLIPHPKK